MKVEAYFKSVNTRNGIRIFRYNTTFYSENGPGNVIGLVYMLNPGDARPESEDLFQKLQIIELETSKPVPTIVDETMKKVIRLIKSAYEYNGIKLPEKYSIHVENLFNIREKNSDQAKKLANILTEANEVMFKCRELNEEYQFVWLAWGNGQIKLDRQKLLYEKFPSAIKVHKLNVKGTIREVSYPIHPLYMNTEFFLESTKGKIKRYPNKKGENRSHIC